MVIYANTNSTLNIFAYYNHGTHKNPHSSNEFDSMVLYSNKLITIYI